MCRWAHRQHRAHPGAPDLTAQCARQGWGMASTGSWQNAPAPASETRKDEATDGGFQKFLGLRQRVVEAGAFLKLRFVQGSWIAQNLGCLAAFPSQGFNLTGYSGGSPNRQDRSASVGSGFHGRDGRLERTPRHSATN